jgi:lysyl-tRNA synthetase class I
MMPSKADYDTLDCPRCDKPTKPAKINVGGSVRYRCDCGDGVEYRWTINLSGEMVNETHYLISN